MFAQRKNHCRSVSSSAVGLNSLNVTSVSTKTVESWVSNGYDATKPRRQVRSFSAEHLHVIPQTKDIESQFQAVLGKCLFDKAVQIAEEECLDRSSPARPGSGDSLCSSRAGSSYGSSGANSPMITDSRTILKLRPTRCSSPLVKGSRSFDSYINKGSIDQLAVARTRGDIESPKPSINRHLRKMKTASEQNLHDFSLKAEFTDRTTETDREQYWRRRQEERILEEELRERKRKEKAEMLVILEEMKRENDERKAKEEAERLRIAKLEEERLAKEKEKELALLQSTENQSNIDDVSSVVSGSSKSSKKRSSKKGGRGSKKDKSSKKGKSASSRKSPRKKSAVAPSKADSEDGSKSGRNTPQPILKSDERRPSDDGSADAGQSKRVTFKDKLVSTRTIRSNKPVASRKGSHKKPFPGSSSSPSASINPRSSSPTPGEKRKKSGSAKGKRSGGKGGKKGSKKKTAVAPAPPPVEPPKEPESPAPEPVVEPVVELEPEEPQAPVVIEADEPPEFCPSTEYKTRRQMVEEWLYYRSCSSSSHANPPIL